MSSNQHDGFLSLLVPGDLTSTTAKDVRGNIESAMDAYRERKGAIAMLELDLQQARFVDSVGINLLVLMIRKTKEQGGNVRIVISNPNVKRVLSFMRVDQHAEIVMKNG